MRASVTAPETSRSMLSAEKSDEDVEAVRLRVAAGDKDAQANRARARLLQRFHVAQPDAHVELVALIHHGFGISGARLQSARQHIGGKLL